MKIQLILFTLIFLCSYNAAGQNDQEAVNILEKFSANAQRAPSVSMKFSLVTSDLAENTNDTLAGSVIISRNNYKLDLTDNIVWYNGDISWSYLLAEKEVTITKPARKDNSFLVQPSALFTMYKKGYKSRLIEERSDSYIVDLYPEDLKSDLIRVRLTIGKSASDLKRLEYKRNDGVVVIILVSEYNLRFKPSQDTFIFKEGNHKGVEVIDMR